MKNLFNNISEEEKQRILEMHKKANNVISEQAVPTPQQRTSPRPNTNQGKINTPRPGMRPTPAPVTTTTTQKKLATDLVNKTINMYVDNTNQTFVGKAKILNAGETSGGFKFKIKAIDGTIGEVLDFDCKNKTFVADDGQMYYNQNFADFISQNYCTKSRGGSDVPKADFAQSGGQSSDMA